MVSSKRIVWGCFTNTLPSMIEDRDRFDFISKSRGIENVFWSIGDTNKFPRILPLYFPQESQHNASTDVAWSTWLKQRYPNIVSVPRALAFLENTFNNLCDAFQPDIYVCWNSHDPTFGIPYEIAKRRGIEVHDLERALVPQFLALGIEIERSRQIDTAGYEEKGRAILEAYPSAHIYTQNLPSIVKAKRKKTLLILGSWDAVVDTSVSCFSSSHEMATFMQSSLNDWNVVYKPHPLSVCLQKVAGTSVSNPLALIKKSDAVLTFGSKLELDVVQLGKPLILARSGFLSGTQAAYTSNTPEECVVAVRTIKRWHDAESAKHALKSFVGYKATHDWYSPRESDAFVQSLDKLLDHIAGSTQPTKKLDLFDSSLKYLGAVGTLKAQDSLQRFSLRELSIYLLKRAGRKVLNAL